MGKRSPRIHVQILVQVQLLDKNKDDVEKKRAPWNIVFVHSLISLHKQLWNDRNTHVHGKTIK